MGIVLVGREDERALLAGLISGLPEKSAVAIVRGEAGIGKTMLVAASLEGVVRHRILRGACAPMSGAVAFGGLDAVLRSGQGAPDSAIFSSVAAGRAWTIGSMLTTVNRIASEGAVLVVEDVHWADASTLDFLAHLSRNLPPTGLLVLLSWRDEVSDSLHLQWIGEQLRNPAVTDVPLRRLTLEETTRQLSRCPPETAADIFHRSAGNPYLSLELANGGPRLSESLRQVLESRLEAVSPAAGTVVAVCATLGRALTDDDLLAAASGDAEAVWEAHRAGLLVRDPEAGTIARHPVLGEVAYERLLAHDRRLLHTRMAEHLAASLPADAGAAAVAEVAEQYRRSGDADASLAWSVRAAEAARQSFGVAEAGHWYAVAASVWDSASDMRYDVPERLSLLDSAATYLSAVGQTADALALLDGELTTLSDSSELVTCAALTRCWLGTAAGDTDRALRDVELAERLTPRDDERTWARIGARRAMALATCSRWEEAHEAALGALQLGTKVNDQRTIGNAHQLLGTEAALAGRALEAREHLEAALAISRRLAEPEDLALAAVSLTDLDWRLGDAERVADVAAAVRPELRRLMLGRHWLEDIIDGNVVQSLFEAGRWDQALGWVEGQGTFSDLGNLQATLAMVHLARGDIDMADELRQGAAFLGDRDQPMFLAAYGEVEARYLLDTGRPAEALECALSIADRVQTAALGRDADGLLLVGLEAAADTAAPQQLEKLVIRLGEAAKGRLASAMTAVVAGERSRAAGVPDPEAWLVAAQEWALVNRPYDEARAHFRAAEAFLGNRHGTGNRHRAADELRSAHLLAEQLGAAPLLEGIRTLAHLARIDPVPEQRPRQAEPTSMFTDREKQVLALLADGRTNREIGAALYMSPKTASVHVTHILEKLGVRTRVQAAAAAAHLGLDNPPSP